MRPPIVLALAFALAPALALADGPADNVAAKVRPIPPAGLPIADADRRALESEISALAQDLQALRKRPQALPHLPDVQIFYLAARTAVDEDQLYAPEEIGKARALLAQGRARARQLAAGKRPWLETSGPTALGYVSELDGSVQPYGLVLPAGWTPGGGRPLPLHVVFHGRGEKLTEVNFLADALKDVPRAGDAPVRPDAAVLAPYGRYCNGSKFAGEVDFFEALADLRRRFRIDDDRVAIRGFSLGGATVWHLAAHFASDFAVAAPGAGFAESARFLETFQNETLAPSWWERTLWQLYDAPVYAENFRNVPVVAYSGANDRQKQAADLMERTLAEVGVRLVHVVGPGTGHRYHPQSLARIEAIIDAAVARGRDPAPRRLWLVTPTLRYNRQAWLTVDALGRHWERATVDAEITGPSEVRLSTRNVTALSLNMGPAKSPFSPGRPVTVSIDGQAVRTAAPASDRSFQAQLVRVGSRWTQGTLPQHALRKRHGLQGPVDDAFMSSFLLVTPGARPLSREGGRWAQAEQMRAIREWRRHFRGEPRVKIDELVTADDVAAHNLVLWGDPSNNRLLAQVAPQLPIKWNAAGIEVGKRRYPADKHALIAIYPNPLNPQRYVVLNSGFTFREYDYLNNARQTPKLPDWAIVDFTTPPDTRAPGKIVEAGFFGEGWEVVPPRPAQPVVAGR